MRAEMFARMAAYNAWANRRLYSACGQLEDAAYYAPRPAFFGSIHRTLNHLLVTDRIWMGRLEGLAGPAMALDTELYTDRHDLRLAREAEDARIASFVAGLDDAACDRESRRLPSRNTTHAASVNGGDAKPVKTAQPNQLVP